MSKKVVNTSKTAVKKKTVAKPAVKKVASKKTTPKKSTTKTTTKKPVAKTGKSIPKEALKPLKEMEEQLSKMEEFLFDKPFSAVYIKEQLNEIASYWKINAIKMNSINTLSSYGINYQNQQSSSGMSSVSEKKAYFDDAINQIEESYISPFTIVIKETVKLYPEDKIATDFYKRCQKCAKEIKKIRSVIQEF